MSSKKAAKKPVVSKGDRTHFNQQAVIDGFLKQGKTIRECAEAQKLGVVYAHRILTTKMPKEYAEEQARRATVKKQAVKTPKAVK